MKIKHLLNVKKCIELIDIDGKGDVFCPECGRHFGFVYSVDPLKAFIYQKFVRYRPRIIKRLQQLVQYPDVLERIDPRFLESNDATISNTIDFLSSAFDENIIYLDDEDCEEDDGMPDDDCEPVAIDYPTEEETEEECE